ncbi:hypothetical protein D9758_009290 [Tetrapyrgos nigripes]|uniref:Uncharacterized protein n=1 Tax=Tetrapyrgos nigripes TaxID=182062 RepID=A0A8H5GHD0_9AGAR|nr:hypothetical protein D9758_009290 [Tetrapyrgos nigripes]
MGDQWSEEQTWELIAEFKKSKNFKVLWGPKAGENTLGDSKATDKGYKLNQEQDYQSTRLETAFKKHANRLKKTGEGIQEPYYITSTGPNHDMDGQVRNIWEDIVDHFPYLPDHWKMIMVQATAPPHLPYLGPSSAAPETLITNAPTSADHSTPPQASQGVLSTTNGLQHTISDSLIDPHLLNTPLATRTPQTPTPASADRENAAPTSSDHRQAPHLSSFSVLKATNKEPPSVIPQKRSFEQDLVDIQQEMMGKVNDCADDHHQAKKVKVQHSEHRLKLEECKLELEERKLAMEAFWMNAIS